MGDYKLSPAYDLLNSRIHIDDSIFALNDGLLPKALAKGKISKQFRILSEQAGINEIIFGELISLMKSNTELVEKLITTSFLNDKTKRSYFQSYKTRLKKMVRE